LIIAALRDFAAAQHVCVVTVLCQLMI